MHLESQQYISRSKWTFCDNNIIDHKVKYLTRFKSKLCNGQYYKHVCAVWKVRSVTDPIRQAVRIRAPAKALCCFLGQDTTQVYERVPANLLLRSTLRWTSLQREVEILLVVSCLIGNLTRMQTLPFMYNNSSFFVRQISGWTTFFLRQFT